MPAASSATTTSFQTGIVCRNTESAVVHAKTQSLWEVVKKLDFSLLTPSIVHRCSLLVPPHCASPKTTDIGDTFSLDDTQYQCVDVASGCKNPFTCATSVGSLRRVEYKDKAEFVFRVVEVSDVHRRVSYELIHTDTTVNVTAVLHTIQLYDVTETSETLVNWTTEFSGDCDPHVYNDCKYKKLDAFKDLRNIKTG